MGSIASPQNLYVAVPKHSTSECDLIWRKSFTEVIKSNEAIRVDSNISSVLIKQGH